MNTKDSMIHTAQERVKLLKAGFTGKQIEALYFVLNRFEIMNVAWDEAATKRAISTQHHPHSFTGSAPACVKAAPSLDEAATKRAPPKIIVLHSFNASSAIARVYAAPSLDVRA